MAAAKDSITLLRFRTLEGEPLPWEEDTLRMWSPPAARSVPDEGSHPFVEPTGDWERTLADLKPPSMGGAPVSLGRGIYREGDVVTNRPTSQIEAAPPPDFDSMDGVEELDLEDVEFVEDVPAPRTRPRTGMRRRSRTG